MNKAPLKNCITLAVEFDQSIFDVIVSHPDLGLEVWNNLIERLIDLNNTMAVWPAGSNPPPVQVFFRFERDLRNRFPNADFRPVYFVEDKIEDSEVNPPMKETRIEEVKVPGILSLLINRP